MTPPRARVAWSIDGRTGHGEWENPWLLWEQPLRRVSR